MSSVNLLLIGIILTKHLSNCQQDPTNTTKCSAGPGGDCLDNYISYNCSYSTCTSVPGDVSADVQELRLRGNQITKIGQEFTNYQQLKLLDLSENKVNTIVAKSFPETLLSLNLSSNDITLEVISEREIFHGLGKLEYLNLARNRIQNLTTQLIFSFWLSGLKHLDLSSNKIESLEHNVLTDLNYLEVLDLSQNLISDPDLSDFLGLESLKLLNMSHNRMGSIPDNMFHGMRDLKTVDLSDNQIETVTEKSFEQAGALETVHLERNRLSVLPSALCFPMKSLKSLYLDGNPLVTIGFGSISPTLKFLSIQNCNSLKEIADVIQTHAEFDQVIIRGNKKLQTISESALGVGTTTKHIDLSENALTTLPESLVAWQNITTANMNGNYWDCDCNMAWIKKLPASNPILDSIVCYNPLYLRGSQAKSLQDSDYSCSVVTRYRRHAALAVVVIFTIVVIAAVVLVLRQCRYRLFPSWYPVGKYETLYSSAEAEADDDNSQPVAIKKYMGDAEPVPV